jgi:Flp pilus assembly pilin Flp
MLDMIMAYVQSVREREEGQALVEYALILALVSVASVVALTALGTSISGILTSITGSL